MVLDRRGDPAADLLGERNLGRSVQADVEAITHGELGTLFFSDLGTFF